MLMRANAHRNITVYAKHMRDKYVRMPTIHLLIYCTQHYNIWLTRLCCSENNMYVRGMDALVREYLK